jgi:hypothetical protein
MRRLILCTLLLLALAAPSFAQSVNVIGTKREDTATATDDLLFPMGAKRCDTAATTGGTDGDLVYFCSDSSGRLWVAIGSIAAGDNNIGNVDIASITAGDTDIGNVDLELAGVAVAEANPVSVRISNGTNWVTPATDQAEDSAEANGVTGPISLTVRRDTAASSAGASGDYATPNTDSLGRMWVRTGDPCADHARISTVAINTASSGNVELVALNSGDIVYVCGYDVVVASAVNIQFVYGTGSACATGETDITGPMPFAANGGIAIANTGVVQLKNAVSNAFCIELSGAVQTSGTLKYVRTAAP